MIQNNSKRAKHVPFTAEYELKRQKRVLFFISRSRKCSMEDVTTV